MFKLKTSEKDVYIIFFLPIFFFQTDYAFTNFFYIALGKAPTREALTNLLTYGSGRRVPGLLTLAWLYLPVLLWYHPIWNFLKTRNDRLKDIVRRRISSVYKALTGYFVLVLAGNIGFHLILYRESIIFRDFFFFNFPAMLFSVFVQMCFGFLLLDQCLAKSVSGLMERLLSREELYTGRGGHRVSLVVKVAILLLGTAVVPIWMLYFYIHKLPSTTPFQLNALDIFVLYVFTVIIVGVSFVFGTLQQPVNGLAEKMKRLSCGDFNVKTRIYFSDEIAQIKSHFNVMVDQLREREHLRETFGKYVSIEIVRQLLKSGKINLGGENISATVMFCDIRNFTPLSERLSAGELIEFLNGYFGYITPPIMANRGVINKFIGDAVMAVYTPVLGSQAHADDAVLSAAGMASALEKFNASGKAPGPVKFGIGIHTGLLVAGNVGTLARLEYTVIGDVVNVASRLESKTRDISADILISGAVHDALTPGVKAIFRFENLGSLALKGKNATVPVFKVAL